MGKKWVQLLLPRIDRFFFFIVLSAFYQSSNARIEANQTVALFVNAWIHFWRAEETWCSFRAIRSFFKKILLESIFYQIHQLRFFLTLHFLFQTLPNLINFSKAQFFANTAYTSRIKIGKKDKKKFLRNSCLISPITSK